MVGRAAYGTGLENQQAEMSRGFKSPTILYKSVYRPEPLQEV